MTASGMLQDCWLWHALCTKCRVKRSQRVYCAPRTCVSTRLAFCWTCSTCSMRCPRLSDMLDSCLCAELTQCDEMRILTVDEAKRSLAQTHKTGVAWKEHTVCNPSGSISNKLNAVHCRCRSTHEEADTLRNDCVTCHPDMLLVCRNGRTDVM